MITIMATSNGVFQERRQAPGSRVPSTEWEPSTARKQIGKAGRGEIAHDWERVLNAAISILKQGEDLLGVVPDESFTRKNAVVFNASIGGHYRHCLDHFTS